MGVLGGDVVEHFAVAPLGFIALAVAEAGGEAFEADVLKMLADGDAVEVEAHDVAGGGATAHFAVTEVDWGSAGGGTTTDREVDAAVGNVAPVEVGTVNTQHIAGGVGAVGGVHGEAVPGIEDLDAC